MPRRMDPGRSHLPLSGSPPRWEPMEASEASGFAPFLLSEELGFLLPEISSPEESQIFGSGGAPVEKPLMPPGLEYGFGGTDAFPFDAAVTIEDLEFVEAHPVPVENHGTGFNRLFDQCPAPPSIPSCETCSRTDLAEAPEFDLSGKEEGLLIATVPVDLIQNRRPFKCSHGGCDKAFKNPQTLKMHHRTHYKELSELPGGNPAKAGQNKKIPCRCPVCMRTFVGLYELRRHYGRKHSDGEKAHGCGKCGKRFYVEADMKDHEKLCGALAGCKCGLKFAFKCNLSAHKRTHPECLKGQPAAPNPHSWKSAASSSSVRSDSTVGKILGKKKKAACN